MQGLLAPQQQTQQPPPQQAPQQQAPQQPQQQGPQQAKATGKTYKIFSSLIQKYVFGNGYEEVVSVLKEMDINEAMSFLVASILEKVNMAAMVNNKKIPPEVIFKSGMALARWLSEIAQKENHLESKEEKEVTENAFFNGMAEFANRAKADSISKQDAQKYIKLLQLVAQKTGHMNQQEGQDERIAG